MSVISKSCNFENGLELLSLQEQVKFNPELEWIKTYIEGDYGRNHRMLHHVPLNVENFLKRFKFNYGTVVNMYRGLTFKNLDWVRNYFRNEVSKVNDNEMIINSNSFTSWTLDQNEAENFAKGGNVFGGKRSSNKFALVLSLRLYGKATEDIYDLRPLHNQSFQEKEVLLRPGIYKCDIETIYLKK